MSDAHIVVIDETTRRPNRWRWLCSCGKECKDPYPTKQNALNGHAVHKFLCAGGR